MKTIWKFPIPGPMRFEQNMPAGAEILSVQMQGDAPQMWALVDPHAALELRVFQSFGTGHDVPPTAVKHLGTLQFDGGALIFHVFEMETVKAHPEAQPWKFHEIQKGGGQ